MKQNGSKVLFLHIITVEILMGGLWKENSHALLVFLALSLFGGAIPVTSVTKGNAHHQGEASNEIITDKNFF